MRRSRADLGIQTGDPPSELSDSLFHVETGGAGGAVAPSGLPARPARPPRTTVRAVAPLALFRSALLRALALFSGEHRLVGLLL